MVVPRDCNLCFMQACLIYNHHNAKQFCVCDLVGYRFGDLGSTGSRMLSGTTPPASEPSQKCWRTLRDTLSLGAFGATSDRSREVRERSNRLVHLISGAARAHSSLNAGALPYIPLALFACISTAHCSPQLNEGRHPLTPSGSNHLQQLLVHPICDHLTS